MDFKEFAKQFNEWQSKPHMFIVNKNRMKAINDANNRLEKIIHEYTPKASVQVNMSEFNDGSAYLSVETSDFVVHNVQEFISIIKEADNFEIYPLNNGNIKIAIMFNGVMNLIR